jgi:hypothetical protein
MAAFRAGATGAGHGAVPHAQGGQGGGRHIAFGGQQGTAFAVPVSHGGTDPRVTAWRNDSEKGRLQTTS